jgi:hypothetical protein
VTSTPPRPGHPAVRGLSPSPPAQSLMFSASANPAPRLHCPPIRGPGGAFLLLPHLPLPPSSRHPSHTPCNPSLSPGHPPSSILHPPSSADAMRCDTMPPPRLPPATPPNERRWLPAPAFPSQWASLLSGCWTTACPSARRRSVPILPRIRSRANAGGRGFRKREWKCLMPNPVKGTRCD